MGGCEVPRVTAPSLLGLAAECRRMIERADSEGEDIDDGNVVDFIADHVPVSLARIRAALVAAGYARRFPQATRQRGLYRGGLNS